MKDKKQFSEIFEVKSREGLYTDTFSRIEKENYKIYRRNKWFSYTFLSLSSISTIGAFVYSITQFNQSGFYTYLSLLFSNMSSVGLYLGDLSMVLAESLPVFSLLLFLSTLFVFILSLMKFTKEKRQNYGFRYA